MSQKSRISEVKGYVEQSVTIGCWLHNKRSSGKIQFLNLRDGSGFIQAVVVKNEVSEATWEAAGKLTQESSLYVIGRIGEDTRSQSRFEMSVESIEIIQITLDYPITPKEHGVDFLMDQWTALYGSRGDGLGASLFLWTNLSCGILSSQYNNLNYHLLPFNI